jgi:carboxylate-amine ligase
MLGVLDVAEKYGIGFYPLAMYPYKYEPKMRTGGWYGLKEKLFGDKWQYAGRCAGFHFHYSLPKGIFNYDDRHLNEQASRKEKQGAVNSYNFGTAIDPVLTTFTQSSPIYQGSFLAKGSRILLYRGGEALKYDGLYNDYQLFGGLQPYVVTYEEIIEGIEERYKKWNAIVKKAGGSVKDLEDKNKLDFSWGPVKVNKVGSIELRNMDMNFPSTLMAVSILTKYALRDVQREGVEIIPNNIGLHEPFKLEDNKIFVPPFMQLSKRIQYYGAWEGLENDLVYEYCKKFFGLCLRFVNKKYYPALRPVKKMLKDRKTRSDEILDFLKKRGYGRGAEVPEEVLREMVLRYSSKLRTDIRKTNKLMDSLTEGDRVWL